MGNLSWLSRRRWEARAEFPSSHEDVRAYIDTFFLDGSLKPIEHAGRCQSSAWVRLGVIHDPKADAVRRFRACGRNSRKKFPTAEVSHRDWQQAAQRWAELVVLRWEWDEALEAADRTAWTRFAVEAGGCFRSVDDEPLRLAAQPAVSPDSQ